MRLVQKIKSYLQLADIKEIENKVDKEVKKTKIIIATLDGERKRFLSKNNEHRQGDSRKVLSNCTCVCDAQEVEREN